MRKCNGHLSNKNVLSNFLKEFLLREESFKAVDFLHELGDRISAVTGDRRESTFLFQRLSVALQKGNAACIIGTMPTEPPD